MGKNSLTLWEVVQGGQNSWAQMLVDDGSIFLAVFSYLVIFMHSCWIQPFLLFKSKTRAWRYPGRRALKSWCVSWEYHPNFREENSSNNGLTFWERIFGLNPKWTKSKCLLRRVALWTKSGCLPRRVDLDFPVGINRGGYYYDMQSRVRWLWMDRCLGWHLIQMCTWLNMFVGNMVC